jgi:hypothetical protein
MGGHADEDGGDAQPTDIERESMAHAHSLQGKILASLRIHREIAVI